jgi:hypothetical protein
MSHPRHRQGADVGHQSLVMIAYLDDDKILGAMIAGGARCMRSQEGDANCRQLQAGARKGRRKSQARKLPPLGGRCGGRRGVY